MTGLMALTALILAGVALQLIYAISKNQILILARIARLEHREGVVKAAKWRVELKPERGRGKPVILELDVNTDADAMRELLAQKIDIGRIITMGPASPSGPLS